MSKEAFADLAEHIDESLEGVQSQKIERDELILQVKRESLLKVLEFLKNDRECDFKILVDITAVDFPDRPERFEVVYNLLSLNQNQRVRVKLATDENTPVPSAVGVFSAGMNARHGTCTAYILAAIPTCAAF